MLLVNPRTFQLSIVEEAVCSTCGTPFEPFTVHCVLCHTSTSILEGHTCAVKDHANDRTGQETPQDGPGDRDSGVAGEDAAAE